MWSQKKGVYQTSEACSSSLFDPGSSRLDYALYTCSSNEEFDFVPTWEGNPVGFSWEKSIFQLMKAQSDATNVTPLNVQQKCLCLSCIVGNVGTSFWQTTGNFCWFSTKNGKFQLCCLHPELPAHLVDATKSHLFCCGFLQRWSLV